MISIRHLTIQQMKRDNCLKIKSFEKLANSEEVEQNLKQLHSIRSQIVYLICLGLTTQAVATYLKIDKLFVKKALQSPLNIPQETEIGLFLY